ncbi:hypothetical protein P692DRAFT_20836988 [Suillus brevipes Sb2]|nr:hypothetical protein P692DRAFT_20836988 [Suillus brevipes Sb2]
MVNRVDQWCQSIFRPGKRAVLVARLREDIWKPDNFVDIFTANEAPAQARENGRTFSSRTFPKFHGA